MHAIGRQFACGSSKLAACCAALRRRHISAQSLPATRPIRLAAMASTALAADSMAIDCPTGPAEPGFSQSGHPYGPFKSTRKHHGNQQHSGRLQSCPRKSAAKTCMPWVRATTPTAAAMPWAPTVTTNCPATATPPAPASAPRWAWAVISPDADILPDHIEQPPGADEDTGLDEAAGDDLHDRDLSEVEDLADDSDDLQADEDDGDADPSRKALNRSGEDVIFRPLQARPCTRTPWRLALV